MRRGLLVLLVLLLVVAGILIYRLPAATPVREMLRSVKDTSQDAATTSKVKTALLLSKHVSAFDIKTTTTRGVVSLTGEVPSEETRRLAGAIAQDTSGVAQVQNDLVVNPGAGRNPAMANLGDRIADLEVKTIVIDRLARAPELKDRRLTVQVARQVVTLEGTVDSPAQKRAAEDIAIQAPGVQSLVSQITVADGQAGPESTDDRLARRVEFELYSTKAVSLKAVQIRSQDGTVVLSGSVPSRAEKLLAEKVAQSVEGVKKVVNNLSAQEPAAG
ncbi:MAG TPA: BON domain-containing protein [Methylomirabilota bacterium]|nr:BON domain-containing protein [Methylomirabilota bacterium]